MQQGLIMKILSQPTSVPLLPTSFYTHLFPSLEPASHLIDAHTLPAVFVPASELVPSLPPFQPYASDGDHDHNPANSGAPLFCSPKQHSKIKGRGKKKKNQTISED